MTQESNMELFDKWTETPDKAEFMKIGKELFPEATEQHLSNLFDESRAGYHAV